MKKSRTAIWVIVGIVVAGSVGAVIAMNRKSSLTGADEIPLALVKRGEIEIEVHARGEVSAANSSMLAAPAIGGDALQITRLPQTGDRIKKGDVVIEFDPSEQHYKLDQNRSELRQAEQEITKAKADALVLAAQDKVALLKAGYDVRRAELDVEKKELDSKIDAQKHELTLQQNKRALAELKKISNLTKLWASRRLSGPGEIQQGETGDGSGTAKPRPHARYRSHGWPGFDPEEHGCERRNLFRRYVAPGLPARRPSTARQCHCAGARSWRNESDCPRSRGSA